MIRAFLSHSSHDKESYVRLVADRLGHDTAAYDEWTFEAGLKPLDEILRNLDTSALFVLFLSGAALESDWVRREIREAEIRKDSDALSMIYPIIIDPKLNYRDERIPTWIRENYNLRLVTKPTVAVRRIYQRLREISWQYHPRIKQRQQIFVGRNDELRAVEERLDDFSKEKPVTIIASGIPRVGRRSFLLSALKKSNVVMPSYEPPVIELERHDSIEDFILKIDDLGYSDAISGVGDWLDKSPEEKREIARTLLVDTQRTGEVVCILDQGCLVNYQRSLSGWFQDVLAGPDVDSRVTLSVASRFRVNRSEIRGSYKAFFIDLPELSVTERRGLLNRLLEYEDIALSNDDFEFFAGLQHGLPEQVIFTVELIKDKGLINARKESHQVTEYNSEKASVLLRKYEEEERVLEFIYLLSEFEFISLDFLFRIVSEDEFSEILDELIASAVCDYIGIEAEFVRLNDSIRDYVQRNRLQMPVDYRKKLQEEVQRLLDKDDLAEQDISTYMYSIKDALKRGEEVDPRYLIPSHFLQSMRELYHHRGNLNRVIALADKVLTKRESLDRAVEDDIRYYLCLSLAKKRDSRLLEEVQHIHGPEHNFLLGYYYRLKGRYRDAIERQERILDEPYIAKRARREMVQLYIALEEYDEALAMARANYEDNRNNQFHIQAYFNCLINSKDRQRYKQELWQLIEELKAVGSEQADEMARIAEARYAMEIDEDFERAFQIVDEAEEMHTESQYPVLAKFDIALRARSVDEMQDAVKRLESMANDGKPVSRNSIVLAKGYLLAVQGNAQEALRLAKPEVSNFTERARARFTERIYSMAGERQ